MMESNKEQAADEELRRGVGCPSCLGLAVTPGLVGNTRTAIAQQVFRDDRREMTAKADER
jgi:hypothetical protein